MNKVYVDIGTGSCDSMNQFWLEVPHVERWTIYAFAQNKEYYDSLVRQYGNYRNVNIYNAVLGPAQKEGTINIIDWMDGLTNKDYVYVKLDLDGLEYYLMPVIKDSLLGKINTLYIKTHIDKFPKAWAHDFRVIEKQLTAACEGRVRLRIDPTNDRFYFRSLMNDDR